MEQLEGRVAVITGAASGIGLAVAERLAAEGMRLVLGDVEATRLAAVREQFEARGVPVLARVFDVRDPAEHAALASEAVERFGGVHLLFANAGVMTAGPAHEQSRDDWEWVLGVNLWGVIHAVRAFLPVLLEQEEAHLLATSSTAGVVAAPLIAPYSVAKFGVVGLMESLARELVRTTVDVSVLCPSNVATRITEAERNRPSELAEGGQGKVAERFLERAGQQIADGMSPEDVAAQVVAAVRARRFWILTHPEWKGILERRIASLVADDALPPTYP
jgi:NAD(P)-dependent dehydrogenase (short-subunit alcohol dehydrogenase family)